MPKMVRQWIYSPRPAKAVSSSLKGQLTAKAEEIIQTIFKPRYLKLPPQKPRFNYIVDIFTKWHKSCLYFCARYACPGPNARSPFFEDSFARLACMGNNRFNLAFMRHTGKWCEVFTDLTMEDAFSTICDDVLFHPPA